MDVFFGLFLSFFFSSAISTRSLLPYRPSHFLAMTSVLPFSRVIRFMCLLRMHFSNRNACFSCIQLQVINIMEKNCTAEFKIILARERKMENDHFKRSSHLNAKRTLLNWIGLNWINFNAQTFSNTKNRVVWEVNEETISLHLKEERRWYNVDNNYTNENATTKSPSKTIVIHIELNK